MKATEKQITAALIDHWRKRRMPNTRVFSIPNARAFGQPGLTPGVFDLGVIAPKLGVAFMELKAEGGTLSEAQKDFQLLLIACNVRYAITYGLDEAVATLEQWGVIRPEARAA